MDRPTPFQTNEAPLRDLFETAGKLPLSFEMFPPRSAEGRASLQEAVKWLADVATNGFSVTMGAGGSTRAGTHDTAVAIREATGRPVTAHLTALGLTRAETIESAERLWESGITRILALRGDPPRAVGEPIPPGYSHAAELVTALRRRRDFEIWVAAYPEKHPTARSLDEDIDHLKEKIDAGASRAICQFVLNPEAYGRFLEECGRHGVDVPIVPGLMPLENWSRVRGFALANGVSVPPWLDRLFTKTADAPEIARMAAMAATAEQARCLVAYGAPALHIYTLNHWQIPLALAWLLGNCSEPGVRIGESFRDQDPPANQPTRTAREG